MRVVLLAISLITSLVSADTEHHSAKQVILAPGYGPLSFEAPEAATYKLEHLGKAADGSVLTSKGKARSLDSLMRDKVIVLSFIYTSCSDVNGCPLASYVLNKVQERIKMNESLRESVRLISLSFDRLNDSPEILENYAVNFRDDSFDWQFLTTPSDEALEKILGAYNQFVITDIDDAGEKVGTLSHILRVYLIDKKKEIRNIYSVSFLHPDIVLNDILTIQLGK